jgi:hypothetical protein
VFKPVRAHFGAHTKKDQCMKNVCLLLALAGPLAVSTASAVDFASGVVGYNPGTGFAVEFSAPHLGFTNPATALGQPNPDSSFGPVTPFNPPFLRSEIVSVGTGGSLTVSFSTPIQNNGANPYGLDFIIYGNSGFADIDYPNGLTDGGPSMLNNPGTTHVSVSPDGVHFYLLNPTLAPGVDTLFPTDSAGTFGLPVNPALGPGDFANRTAAEIQSLYAGSAGGTGFDLAWAVDENNLPVYLSSISQIRVDVLTGRAEIDGFAAVIPEPATASLLCAGVGILWLRRRVR